MVVFDAGVLTPGMGVDGKRGPDGPRGKNGSAVFYAPYDLRTSNNMDFVLARIKSNTTFDDSVSELPDGRPYQDGDIISDTNGITWIISGGRTKLERTAMTETPRVSNSVTDASMSSDGTFTFTAEEDSHNRYDLMWKDGGGRERIIKNISGSAVISGAYSDVRVRMKDPNTGRFLIYDAAVEGGA